MTTFDSAVRFVLQEEGGSAITNDSHDHGGLTRFGISKTAHPDVDIANLTEAQAIQIYHDDYWVPCQCDRLPPVTACIVFDTAVNQGVGAAIRILQQALEVTVDGLIGPKTVAAAQSREDRPFINELIARRLVVYGLNPQFTHYGLGWTRRSIKCHQFALDVE